VRILDVRPPTRDLWGAQFLEGSVQRMCEFKFWLFSVYPLADGAVPQNASFVVLLPPLLTACKSSTVRTDSKLKGGRAARNRSGVPVM
jgi:hypothetical protein